jgi:cytochrome d ubiquinol oxidase subunit I
LIYHNRFLKAIVFCIPLGFIALEAGWTVTEVGRQPWIIYKVMRTADAVTPMPGIQYSFYITMVIYVFLSLILLWLMKRQIGAIHKQYPLN